MIETCDLKSFSKNIGKTYVLCEEGQGSSPFEMKWRESISWFRLNIIDLTVYRLPHHLKF